MPVSILVLMEDDLKDEVTGHKIGETYVSILVLMEDDLKGIAPRTALPA